MLLVGICAAGLVALPAAFAATSQGAFLNPSNGDSNGPGTYISDKDNGTNTSYRFVVETAPPSGGSITGVRIEVQPSGSSSWTSAGDSTQVGTTDTWELQWAQSSSGPTSGDGAVRAVLQGSDGSTTYVPSESGQTVHFDTSRPTASITAPFDGGQLAFVSNVATLSGPASSDTTSISGFYTTTPAAAAPTWTLCGSTSTFAAGPGNGQSFSVNCTLSGSDSADHVTGVAVLPLAASPIPFLPSTQGAGDAVRVVQPQSSPSPSPSASSSPPSHTPAKLSLGPQGIRRAIETRQVFTTHVADRAGRPVGGVRVRFAATGANRATGSATTGPGGNATFGYVGRRLGTDTVSATSGRLHTRSQIVWTKAPTTLTIRKRPTGPTSPGQFVSAYGKLSSPAGSCVGGKTIVLKASDGRVIARTRTRPRGGYSFSGRPRRSVDVRATFGGTARCDASRSPLLGVHVV